jgi:hypothetical protein
MGRTQHHGTNKREEALETSPAITHPERNKNSAGLVARYYRVLSPSQTVVDRPDLRDDRVEEATTASVIRQRPGRQITCSIVSSPIIVIEIEINFFHPFVRVGELRTRCANSSASPYHHDSAMPYIQLCCGRRCQ